MKAGFKGGSAGRSARSRPRAPDGRRGAGRPRAPEEPRGPREGYRTRPARPPTRVPSPLTGTVPLPSSERGLPANRWIAGPRVSSPSASASPKRLFSAREPLARGGRARHALVARSGLSPDMRSDAMAPAKRPGCPRRPEKQSAAQPANLPVVEEDLRQGAVVTLHPDRVRRLPLQSKRPLLARTSPANGLPKRCGRRGRPPASSACQAPAAASLPPDTFTRPRSHGS